MQVSPLYSEIELFYAKSNRSSKHTKALPPFNELSHHSHGIYDESIQNFSQHMKCSSQQKLLYKNYPSDKI